MSDLRIYDLDSNALSMSSQYMMVGYESMQPAEKVKRPMNAFMVWASGRRREISSKCPALHNSDISRMLGGEWKTLSESQKRPYREESKRLVLQHKQEHPDYKYCPKRKQKVVNTPYSGRPTRNIAATTGSPPSMASRVPPSYLDRSDQVSERSDESGDRADQSADDGVRNYRLVDLLRKPENQNEEQSHNFGEYHPQSNSDLGTDKRRVKSLAAGCTAIVGNPMEVFRSQQGPNMDGCSIYETGNKTVVVTFAKYNLTLRLEPEKLAASLLPIFHS